MVHPLIVWGALVLVGYWIDERNLAAQREREKLERQSRAIKARRRKERARAKAEVNSSALQATWQMIAILKEERRTAARTRDTLPWGSEEREKAHTLVRELSRRIDALYEKKRQLQAEFPHP